MQVQGFTLPQVQLIRRIASSQLGPQPLPSHGFEYARQLSANGDSYEIQGLVDRARLEELFGIPTDGAIWVTDNSHGNFHATLEVSASWVADDAPQIERSV